MVGKHTTDDDSAGQASTSVASMLNRHAHHQTNQQPRVLAVVLPRSAQSLLAQPLFAFLVQGIEQVCRQQGYLALLSLRAQEMQETMLCNMLRGSHFAGVVLIKSDMHDPLPNFLQEAHIPSTCIGHSPDVSDHQCVDIDHVEGVYKAIMHLILLGHRRIAYIGGPTGEASTAAHYAGYQKALQEVGRELDPELIEVGDWSHMSGRAAAQHVVCLDRPPTAIFAANDMMAAGALHALRERNLTVPDDIALVGFDDFPQTGMIIPPLTTVSQPGVAMGSCAAEMLIGQIEGKNCRPAHVILPTTLIVRQSCGATRQHAAIL